MKFSYLLIGAVMLCEIVNAQQPQEFYQSPKITPASPEAAAIYKFSETPLNYSSGVATQTIPLYTLKVGEIECPISISYSTGGIKVQDIASMVGLGWNLNWGGIIYQQGEIVPNSASALIENNTIKSTSDVSNHINESGTWERLESIAGGNGEKQRPEYHFNFGQYSGSFFFDIYDNVHISSGNHNLIIERIISTDNNPLNDGIKIITDNGIQYTFLTIETSFPISGGIRKTGYLISEIKSLNTGDYINFNYESKPSYMDNSSESYNAFRILSSQIVYAQGCGWGTGSNESYFVNRTTVNSKRISSITSSNGTVRFLAATDRLDLDPTRITDVVVTNNNGNVIKKVKFNQSYFISDPSKAKVGYRLKLDGLTFYNSSILKSEKFDFEYNNIMLPPYADEYNGRNNTALDYWGYYNGKNYNSGLIPSNLASEQGFVGLTYSGDRNVDIQYTQACLLKKITYPTGGYVSFSFENNSVFNGILGTQAGGLRVKRITYSDNTVGNSFTKEYSYKDALVPLMPVSNNYFYDKYKDAGCGCSGDIGSGRTRYLTRTISNSPVGSYSYFNLSTFYRTVEETSKSNNLDNGKTIYRYDVPEYSTQYTSIPEFGGVIAYEKKWSNQNLLKQIDIYKKGNSDTYTLLKTEKNTFDIYKETNYTIGLYSVRKTGDDYVGDPYYFQCEAKTNLKRVSENIYGDSYSSSGIKLLTKKQVYEYLEGGTVESTNDYEYETIKYQLKKITTLKSNKDTKITLFKYSYEPDDLTGISTSERVVLSNMVTKNMIAQPVEQETYVNSILTKRDRSVYNTWNSNSQYLQYYKQQLNNNSIEIKNEVSQYDTHGKITEYRITDNIYNTVLWDETGSNPIAEVSNAKLADIAYTSFENLGTLYSGIVLGSWTVSNYNGPANNTQSNIPMGMYCLPTSTSTSITKSGLTASGTYIVSYWSNSGSYTVSGTSTLVQGKTLNGWTNYTHTITGVTSVTVSGTAGYIDELRFYPFKAQMTSYEYVPSVGLQTTCSISGKMTHYEYDDMGYLTLIRDEDNNIVKKIARAYRDVTVNFGTIYRNIEQTKVFFKNNCAVGGVGFAVPYTVLANSYSSTISQDDADAQAQNEIDLNGQDRANTSLTASCTFYNLLAISKYFVRNNCSAGTVGVPKKFVIDAYTYSSTISQADANTKAQNALNSLGLVYANANGTCVTEVPTINVQYINQTQVYWSIQITNTSTNAVTNATLGSSFSGTAFSNLPSGNYNIVFSSISSLGQSSVIKFTVNGNEENTSPPYSSGATITFNNVAITAGSFDPLIKVNEYVPPVSCNLVGASGWTVNTSNIYQGAGTLIDFSALVMPSTSVTVNSVNVYTIGAISCSRPSAVRTFTVQESGRTWSVNVNPSGTVSIQLTAGVPPASNTSISLNGTYSL